jgi:hypothetical protein
MGDYLSPPLGSVLLQSTFQTFSPTPLLALLLLPLDDIALSHLHAPLASHASMIFL